MSSMERENLREFEILAKNLKELRKLYSYTQKEVAEKLGVTYQSYQAYEIGIAVPTLQNFIKLAEIYDVSLDYLIGKKDLWNHKVKNGENSPCFTFLP